MFLVKTQADENQPITNLQPVSKKLKKDLNSLQTRVLWGASQFQENFPKSLIFE